MMYLKYLQYLLRHKWFVMLECFKEGLFWRGLTHDLSKFGSKEFGPYARNFFWPHENPPVEMDVTSTVDWAEQQNINKAERKRLFDIAWLHHMNANDHHWNYWVIRNDDYNVVIVPMPIASAKEMVCDWRGMSRARNGKDDSLTWYRINRDKMMIHKDTRIIIEEMLGFYPEQIPVNTD